MSHSPANRLPQLHVYMYTPITHICPTAMPHKDTPALSRPSHTHSCRLHSHTTHRHICFPHTYTHTQTLHTSLPTATTNKDPHFPPHVHLPTHRHTTCTRIRTHTCCTYVSYTYTYHLHRRMTSIHTTHTQMRHVHSYICMLQADPLYMCIYVSECTCAHTQGSYIEIT